jgi:hypothetical protein
MTIPQLLVDMLALLFNLAVPAAMCTLVLAGIALQQEGGVNFDVGGRFQRWMMWSAILLTLPQFLSWFAARGIGVPPQAGAPSSWLGSLENTFTTFVSDVVVGRLVPVLGAFLVLKASLDGAEGRNPLGSVIAAMFVLSVSGTLRMMQGLNSGSEFATTDLLASLWTYIAGTILPLAAGLAVVGAIVNYSRQRPFMPMVAAGLAFLSVTALWRLVQVMVG